MAVVGDRPTGARSSPWSLGQLEGVLAAVADPIIVLDSGGRVVFANDAAAGWLGLPRGVLRAGARQGAGILEVLDETGAAFPAAESRDWGQLRAGAGAERLLRLRIGRDEGERRARAAVSATVESDGRPAFVVCTFRDAAVDEGRAALGRPDVLDLIDSAVVVLDARGRLSHWNRAAETLLGWGRDEIVGRRLADFVVASDGGFAESLVERTREGRTWQAELLVRHRDGQIVPLYLGLRPLRNAYGTVVGAIGAEFDGIDRRRVQAELRISEARYRTLADSLPHIVWTARPDGSVDHFNERFLEYTGVRPEEAMGWSWERVVHPDDLPQLLDAWSASIRDGSPLEDEHRLRRADGAYRWFLARGLPLRAPDGEVIAWIGTSTDIEDRKRAEQGLAFLAEASRALSESLDYESTLASVARLAVPAVADWCVIDLLGPHGEVEMVGAAHVDPARIELAKEVRRRWPPRTDETSVLATGTPRLVEEITDELLRQSTEDQELLGILRDLKLTSAMVVPLQTDGRTTGMITFFNAESCRRFDRTDLALAEDLARRAATAIENAVLYRRVSQFKGAVDNATDCIFMYDPETLVFSYVNRGATEQVGYTAAELLAMTPLDLKPEFDEGRYRALIAPLLAGEVDSRSFTTVQRRKDGVDIPVDVVLQRIAVGPGSDRIIAFVRDVTERMDTQARLQRLAQAERTRAAEVDAVIRAMGEAVVVCDADGFVTLSNPAADSLLAGAVITRYEQVVGLFDDGEGRAPLLGVNHVQGPIELPLNGRRRWVEITAYPVLLEHDAATESPSRHAGMTIFVMRDVTAQREADAMREAFVGVLSHELRTPLKSIYGGSKVLLRLDARLTDAARRDVYADIEAEADRLYRLVEDLLVLARFGEEPVKLGDEPVLLQRILPVMVESEQVRWPTTRFEIDIPPGLPTVRADPTYVEQVARNLLANGAKYGPPGGTVRLSLEAMDDEVRVLVRDEGPGFPAREADQLFDLFYRSPLTAAQAPGAGIGLFVCRRLIEAMGGRMWATNRPEGGSEFGFTLQTFADDE